MGEPADRSGAVGGRRGWRGGHLTRRGRETGRRRIRDEDAAEAAGGRGVRRRAAAGAGGPAAAAGGSKPAGKRKRSQTSMGGAGTDAGTGGQEVTGCVSRTVRDSRGESIFRPDPGTTSGGSDG